MDLKKIIRNGLVSLVYGLKRTESDILTRKSTVNSDANILEQQTSTNELADALLHGVVTEEVALLRDRMYLVSNEAKKYVTSPEVIIDEATGKKTYTGEVITKRKSMIVGNPKIFEEDGYKLVLSMETPLLVNASNESYKNYSNKEIEKATTALKFEYDWKEKFKLERCVNKVAIRCCDKLREYKLDLYVTKYPSDEDQLFRSLNTEISRIKEGNLPSTNLSFKTVYFVTDNAFGADDLCEYKFEMSKFRKVNEHNGSYVLSYDVQAVTLGYKITDKYIKPELREKYKNKERKDVKLVADFSDLKV